MERRYEWRYTQSQEARSTCAVEAGRILLPADCPSSAGGPEWETYLEYERYKGEYRILVTHVVDGDPHETKPWAESSRNVKLKSLDALPELIEALLKTVREQVTQAQAQVDLLDSIIPSANESPGRSSSARKG